MIAREALGVLQERDNGPRLRVELGWSTALVASSAAS